ncbi:MAG: hypothetical protein IPO21_01115 [Bacteroidales bacterium]|nr:hypothetical protein [Bacteroidales bacterium]
MKKFNLFLIGFLLLTGSLFSQEAVIQKKLTKEEKRAPYTTAIMIMPQMLASHGLRMDFEFRIGKNAIVIAPTYYNKYNHDYYDYYYDDFKKKEGAGIDIAYKLNLTDPNRVFVPYAAANLSYDFYSVDVVDVTENYYYDEYGYSQSSEYYTNEKHFDIHKLGVDALMGFQITPIPRFVIDFSVGVGTRHSFAKNDEEEMRSRFGDNILDMAFTGIIPTTNFKIGIKL